MSVPVQDPINQIVIAGGETTAPWTWFLKQESEIVVTKNIAATGITVLLTLGVDFTVNPAGLGMDGGGTINFEAPQLPAQVGDVWTMSRDTTLNRSPDFATSGDFFAQTINDQLDKLTRISQDSDRDAVTAVRKDPGVGDVLNPLIPQMVDRRALLFQDNGGGNFEMIMSDNDPDTGANDAAASAAAALVSEQNAAVSETNAATSAADAAASAAQVPLSNVTAVTDPLVTDDNTLGYGINSHWVNTVTDQLFIAFDVSTGAAVWILDKLELANNAEAIGGVENTKAMTSLRVKESIDTFADTATVQKNVMLNAFRIAINGSLPLLNMVDGFVDEFEDENGVDTGASINQSYDPVNDLYENVAVGTTDLVPVMTSDTTPSGVCSASTIFGAGSEAFRAFDETSTEWLTQNAVPTGWIQYQFTSGQIAFAARLQCGNNVTQMARDFTVEGSNTGAFGGEETILVTKINETGWTINEKRTFDFTTTGSFTFYRVDITALNGGSTVRVQEVEFLDAAVVDMTLISNSQVAENVPTEASIILFEEDVDAQILNTDLKGFASRDGGTTFTQITLADDGDYQSGRRILSGTADISGQPSGTSMRYKVETLNTMELKLHGVSLEWS